MEEIMNIQPDHINFNVQGALPPIRTFMDIPMVASLSDGAHKTVAYIRESVSQETKERAGLALTLGWGMPGIPGLLVMASGASSGSAQLVAAGLLGPMAIGFGLGAAMLVVGGFGDVARRFSAEQFEKVKEQFRPVDNTTVKAEELQHAIDSHDPHARFTDPITYDLIDNPVTFVEDPAKRAFDSKSIETHKQAGYSRHPTLNRPYSELTMVRMPELKKQIDQYKAAWPEDVAPDAPMDDIPMDVPPDVLNDDAQ
jgi:hypothetical protein